MFFLLTPKGIFLTILALYLLISVISTVVSFVVINRVGLLCCQGRPTIYKKSGLQSFCEKPIITQIFPKCLTMGFMPIINLLNIISFAINSKELVRETANAIIEEWVWSASEEDLKEANKDLEQLYEMVDVFKRGL